MADAQGAEVGAVRGAAGVPGDGVVDLGESGAAVAAGEPAGAVAGHDEVAQRRGHGVGRAAAVEQVPGQRVGDQAADRRGVVGGDQGADRLRGQGLRPARAEAGDRAGPLGQADQGRQVDDDVDVGADRGRRPRVGGRAGGRRSPRRCAVGGRVGRARRWSCSGGGWPPLRIRWVRASARRSPIPASAGVPADSGSRGSLGDAGDDAEAGLRLRESHPGDEQRHAVGLGDQVDVAAAMLRLAALRDVRGIDARAGRARPPSGSQPRPCAWLPPARRPRAPCRPRGRRGPRGRPDPRGRRHRPSRRSRPGAARPRRWHRHDGR